MPYCRGSLPHWGRLVKQNGRIQSKQRKNWGHCRYRFHSYENTETFLLTEFRSCRNDLLGPKFKELFSHRILFWHHYCTGLLHRHKRTTTDPHLQVRLYFALGIDKALTKGISLFSTRIWVWFYVMRTAMKRKGLVAFLRDKYPVKAS